MNPLRPIFSFFKFIYNDFKSDIVFLIDLSKGKRKINVDVASLNIQFIGKTYKEYWWVFLLLALAFFSGMWVSSQNYQEQCNNFIVNEVVPAVNEQCGSKTYGVDTIVPLDSGVFNVPIPNISINPPNT